jgi:uncharacterized protein (PEP-CTERM system associated)
MDVTDNVDLAPSGSRRSDVYFQITPILTINKKTAHTSVTGNVSAPILLYARTGEDNNTVRPEVHLKGTAELVPRLFYLDGTAEVSQQYFNPFGARPQNLGSATQNRYTAQSYSVSPYVKGTAGDGIRYELRDNNIWADATNSPTRTTRSYTNDLTGSYVRDPRPFGYGFEYDRSETRFRDQEPLRTEIARASALWRPEPQWELSAHGGYEDNEYPLASSSGYVYGAGVRWHPTSRTTVDANGEHRFFGASYHLTFDHRTPLSVWTVRASRDITTYPQQLASLGAGTEVSVLLDRLFSSRIADPVERQNAVDQLIRDRGLPAVLGSPLTLYTQSITLQESLQATLGLLGVRNTIFATVYRLRNQPIGGDSSAPVDLLLVQNDNTQNGVNGVWTHKLTPMYTLTTIGDFVHTTPNEFGGRSNQATLRVIVSAAVSPLTNVYAGARYQRLISDIAADYREAAAFVGIGHIFR